jgi:hypothetical protein
VYRSFAYAAKGAAFALAMLLVAGPPDAYGHELSRDTFVQASPRFETWSGVEVMGSAWSVYGGVLFAPSGSIDADGWRLRAGAAYGAYRYDGQRRDSNTGQQPRFEAAHHSVDLLVGYRQTLGPWVVKVYVGGTQEHHDVQPFDVLNEVTGGRLGVKAALETWLSVGEWGFLQADAGWSQPFSAFASRIRAGYRLSPAISLGPETAILGNTSYEAARAGTFVRYEWTSGELSASGGMSGDRDHATGAYGTFSVLFRF